MISLMLALYTNNYLLSLGLFWIVPAWREPRFLYAMAFWDLLALLLWAWDLSRIPRPAQLNISRVWKQALGLAQQMEIAAAISGILLVIAIGGLWRQLRLTHARTKVAEEEVVNSA